MALLPIKTVGVIGAGLMGASWTALFLAKGLQVIVTDPAPGAKEMLHDFLNERWPTMARLGIKHGASLDNYKFVPDISAYLGHIDFVQENGPERLDFKRKLFAHLDSNTREHVILASSSSGLPSSQFVTDCKRNPARVLIGHPFNPPHLVPLVEVVPNPNTGTAYVKAALEFYRGLDKEPVLVNRETPGFVANRLQAALCAEAYSLISRGIVSARDLDKTVTSGIGLRWALNGPIMTNVLGGGRDFKYFMNHLGPALKTWSDDMRDHEFDFSREKIDVLDKIVQEWVSTVDIDGVERKRDNYIVGMINNESDASI